MWSQTLDGSFRPLYRSPHTKSDLIKRKMKRKFKSYHPSTVKENIAQIFLYQMKTSAVCLCVCIHACMSSSISPSVRWAGLPFVRLHPQSHLSNFLFLFSSIYLSIYVLTINGIAVDCSSNFISRLNQ